jgi:tRNA U34 5-carboxymethylaminomethyl modifying enzyme MnmG/GidA
VEIQVKYAGYIQRQEEQVAKLKKLEEMGSPDGLLFYPGTFSRN